MATIRKQHGHYLEDFRPGSLLRHKGGKTVTDGLFALFTDFSFTPNPLSKNVRYAQAYGYRGLVREIIARITRESFPKRKVRVVATGGYAQLIARQLPEIEAVHDGLTLDGLRLIGNMNI